MHAKMITFWRNKCFVEQTYKIIGVIKEKELRTKHALNVQLTNVTRLKSTFNRIFFPKHACKNVDREKPF